MFVFALVLMLVLLAILGPLLGTDSRDGLDWTPGHFWLPRPSSCSIVPDLTSAAAGGP